MLKKTTQLLTDTINFALTFSENGKGYSDAMEVKKNFETGIEQIKVLSNTTATELEKFNAKVFLKGTIAGTIDVMISKMKQELVSNDSFLTARAKEKSWRAIADREECIEEITQLG